MKFIKILVILIIFCQIGSVSAIDEIHESDPKVPPLVLLIPLSDYFAIEKTSTESELSNIGMTYIWYNVTVFTNARRDVDLSKFYFSVSPMNNSKTNYEIDGEKDGKIKFPKRPRDIVLKGKSINFNFTIRFKEEGDFNLHLYQGLDSNYPRFDTAPDKERGVTLINMEIVSPSKYIELKSQKDLAESSKISAKAAGDSAVAARISAAESAKTAESVRGLLNEFQSTTVWTKRSAFATGLMAIFTFLVVLTSHINTTKQIEGLNLPNLKLNVVMDSGVPKLKIIIDGVGINELKLKISYKNKILIEKEKEVLGEIFGSDWNIELDKKSFIPDSENLIFVELDWKSKIGGTFYRKWELKVQVTEEHKDFRLINDQVIIRTKNPWDIPIIVKNIMNTIGLWRKSEDSS